MKNIAKNFTLNSITRWTYINRKNWCDDPEYGVITVIVERITRLNGEILSKKTIERQDMVLRALSKESMAAEACLKMSSIHIDEEVYVGF